MYHPAAGLYRGEVKNTLFSDFAKVPIYLEEVKKKKEQEKINNIEQIELL